MIVALLMTIPILFLRSMNKKIIILSVLISLFSSSAFAQIDADITRPSVNAEQFGLAMKAESALNRGQLSVNIPLMTLKGKGYDLPISLAFYSGDVTCTAEASPIGLGWALVAGGVISTTIKGTEDIEDYTQDGKDDHHTNSSYIEDNISATFFNDYLDRIRFNSMPDEYTYSLPGHSGTIEISVDNNNTINRSLFPDESYKIEQTESGYCITADDGTKFYFETSEGKLTGSWPYNIISTSWFLTRIVTTKGGEFTFHYSEEEYIDLSSTRDLNSDYVTYRTQRIDSIHSEFGTVTFNAVNRNDRGSIGNQTITSGMESKRINQIVQKDENGNFVKGYELDNSDYFKLHENPNETPDNSWYNYRLKLSSITQYDSAGNRLPPYRFTYDYMLSKSIFAYTMLETDSCGNYFPYDSWTSSSGPQVYVDLYGGSNGSLPYCSIGDQPNAVPSGFTMSSGASNAATAGDYFCLDSIYYPNGTIDAFFYEPHTYGKINNTNDHYDATIQGRRLASKIRFGSEINQRTDYVYKLHDSNYNALEDTNSGVLTNPSIHSATYYTPEYVTSFGWICRASRITSGKPFNSFMGPPVCYTEVEEVEKTESSYVLNRTIHYFEPQTVSPPVNYVLIQPQFAFPTLIKVENLIYGKKSGYSNGMEVSNDVCYNYTAYPVGEFYNSAILVDKPLKEVFIGKDGKVRSIKQYLYDTRDCNIGKKYGYRLFSPENSNYTLISKSEYLTRRIRPFLINTTKYFYDGNECDSICESNGVDYNKGRVACTNNTRGDESNITYYFYPDDIPNIVGNNSSPELTAINGLIEKNIVVDPIKTIVKFNDNVVGGECKNYQMVSDKPLLNSLYKVKNAIDIYSSTPTISGGTINYHAELYKEGEVITYDEYHNPMYVKLNNTIDRIYVWGYGGRFPIAVIDNMDNATFQASTNLKSQILQLETYTKIKTGNICTALRSLNASIRSLLPGSAHITTYTYDPYFGMTSEIDDSNLGTIFTYDSFGRLTTKYDVNYNKLEEYNYHYKLQQ